MNHIEAQKLALRDQIVTARGRIGVAEIAARARAVRDALLASTDVRRAATVACYVSVGREPGTGPILEALAAAGKRVILPLLQPDDDLDWGVYDGPQSLASARRGLLEPVGPPLGPDAVATADVVLVPGLAVDRTGLRLGRGGGSYDRALARATGLSVVVLNSEEVVDRVPADVHDRRVAAVVTEIGLYRLDASR
ncbi:5-formyltetrahydrofolate cyclo-ligase [Nocardioides terrisoli]|uniref:5-formyltetrahydrofolate cyclo-ligase n=1 Tax=Nocardioides terrisoli TaxID=3388267 RepID=UPI00287B6753|nr:5-formyltetrahydrofolate cyclo-ligase [Nocardioides marmorisolisilvae]